MSKKRQPRWKTFLDKDGYYYDVKSKKKKKYYKYFSSPTEKQKNSKRYLNWRYNLGYIHGADAVDDIKRLKKRDYSNSLQDHIDDAQIKLRDHQYIQTHPRFDIGFKEYNKGYVARLKKSKKVIGIK